MRIGLSTPVVMQLPGVSSAWEERTGADELARIARTADEYGFDRLPMIVFMVLNTVVAGVSLQAYFE